jgi:hypothetical protein
LEFPSILLVHTVSNIVSSGFQSVLCNHCTICGNCQAGCGTLQVSGGVSPLLHKDGGLSFELMLVAMRYIIEQRAIIKLTGVQESRMQSRMQRDTSPPPPLSLDHVTTIGRRLQEEGGRVCS